MRTVLSVAICFFAIHTIVAQCPTGPIAFTSQSELNDFPLDFPSCTLLPDGVDVEISGNDITDLTPLSQLTGSLAAFEIRDCPNLVSLVGMNQFEVIGNDALDGFILRDLPALTSIAALSNLDSLTGEFTIRTCAQLTSLSGLDNLNYVNGSVIIRDNAQLGSLNGLSSLDYIGETLELVENTALTDISALSNVNDIVGGIEGGVFIEGNILLTNLTGLGNATTSIGSNLDLLFNDELSLCAVPSICKYLSNPPVGAVISIASNTIGCNSQVEIENLCPSLDISNMNEDVDAFLVYGNESGTELTIESNREQEVRIVDAAGKQKAYTVEVGINKIDISSWNSGVYLIQRANAKALRWIKL